MPTYQISDQTLAFGLSWLPPDAIPASSRESRKIRYLASLKPTPKGYVSISSSSGTQFGTTDDAQDIGIQSAAASLALIHPSIVVIEQLDADFFWLCAIEDGAVFPAGDVVGDKDLIISRFKEIETDIAGTDIRPCSIVEFVNSPNLKRVDFSELIAESSPAEDIRCIAIEVQSKRRPVVVALLVAALCIYPAWKFVFQFFESAPVVTHDGADALQKEIDHFTELLNQNASVLIATFADAIHNRPLRAGGWQNTSYEWQNDMAKAYWTRKHGNLASISEYLSKRNFELIETSGVVVESFEFPALKQSETKPVDSIAGGQQERYRLIDILAQMPGKWSLGTARTTGTHLKISESQLKGSSKRLANLILFAREVHNQPFVASRIKVDLESSFAWEIEGHYYAKTN